MLNYVIDKVIEIFKENVTCVQLSPVTGSLLAAGSRDREVCLWNLDSPSCIHSLDGHLSSVESVCFSTDEKEVGAGSMSGSMKVWSLNSRKITASFSGHRGKVTCIAHSPMNGSIWASGSLDNSAKIWDARASMHPVHSFKEHTRKVSRVFFSPDGRWLVSASDDCSVKLWDVTSGQRFANFALHSGSVTDVQFHPNEYLLASGSSDRTVRFWDLESLECVSQSDSDFGVVRCVMFAPDGDCVYCITTVGLRTLGWEPACTFQQLRFDFLGNIWQEVRACGYVKAEDAVAMLCFGQNNTGITVCLVNASKFEAYRKEGMADNPMTSSVGSMKHFQSESSLVVSHNRLNALNVDCALSRSNSFKLKRRENATLNTSAPLPPTYCTLPRKTTSASAKNRGPQHASWETNSAGEEGEIESELSTPDALFSPIYFESSDVEDDKYSTAFQPKHCLQRSPVSSPVPSLPCQNTGAKASTSTSKAVGSGREHSQTFSSVSCPKGRGSLIPVSSRCDISSTISTGRSVRSDMVTKSVSTNDSKPTGRQVTVLPQTMRSSKLVKKPVPAAPVPPKKVVHEVTPLIQILPPKRSPPPIVAVTAGLSHCNVSADENAMKDTFDFTTLASKDHVIIPDDFLPHNISAVGGSHSSAVTRFSAVTEQDCLRTIESSAVSMSAVLQHREKSLEMVKTFWRTQGLKQALDVAIQTNDLAVLVDLLNVLNLKSNLWNLDACVLVLPQLKRLLDSKYDVYVNTAVNSLRLLLRGFTEVIKSGIARIPSLGVDISGEERNLKCKECYSALISIRDMVIEKQKTAPDSGKHAQAFKEIELMMRTLN